VLVQGHRGRYLRWARGVAMVSSIFQASVAAYVDGKFLVELVHHCFGCVPVACDLRYLVQAISFMTCCDRVSFFFLA
jgi:hypothetical protein